mgnify:CR=1 FL=1
MLFIRKAQGGGFSLLEGIFFLGYSPMVLQSHSRSEVEGSRIPLLDSFYNLAILGNFQKVDTLVSHVINSI